MLDRRCVLLDGLQDSSCASDSRVQKLLLDICNIEVKRACGVDNGVERRVTDDCSVKRSVQRDVLHNYHIQPIFTNISIPRLDSRAFLRGTHGGNNTISSIDQAVQNVSGNKARTSCQKYPRHLEYASLLYSELNVVLQSGMSIEETKAFSARRMSKLDRNSNRK